MTASETVQMVRMLIDDSREWYPMPYAGAELPIVKAINDAQIQKLKQYYVHNDERGMRPFYKYISRITNLSTINDLFFPRAVKIVTDQGSEPTNGECATYLEYSKFSNFTMDNGFASGANFPRAAYYTISQTYSGGSYQSVIEFTKPTANSNASIWYVRYPHRFQWDPTGTTNFDLELPKEYHIEVCSLAAEMLNDIDVLEQERSNRMFQNEYVPIEKAGEGGVKIG